MHNVHYLFFVHIRLTEHRTLVTINKTKLLRYFVSFENRRVSYQSMAQHKITSNPPKLSFLSACNLKNSFHLGGQFSCNIFIQLLQNMHKLSPMQVPAFSPSSSCNIDIIAAYLMATEICHKSNEAAQSLISTYNTWQCSDRYSQPCRLEYSHVRYCWMYSDSHNQIGWDPHMYARQ